MSQTTSSTMSKGPHLCLKNMLSKTDIVQLKALAANKLSIRRISELTGFARNTISKYLKGAEPVMKPKSGQARRLQDNRERVRQELFDSGCNCAVVQRNLQEQGVRIGLRQLQRFSEPLHLQYKAVKNTADATKPHRVITYRLTSARKPSWSMTGPSKSTCSLPYWLSPDGFLPRLTLRKINPHGLMALNRHFSSSRRVQERSSATTPDVWFAPTNAAAQSNGRKPLRAFVSTGPSNLLLVRHIIRSQRERWKERCAMYKAMPCKANRSKVCRRSIIGWSTGP